MQPDLVEVLACPACRGDLKVDSVDERRGRHIYRGRLTCTTCSENYPIERSVPRLVIADEDVKSVGRRYGHQWLNWSRGRFEDKSRSYGYDNRIFCEWQRDRLAEVGPIEAGQWMLDAGCGAGHLTEHFADMLPQARIVGMDLGLEALEYATEKYTTHQNVDYVQGNVLQPPFKQGVFRWGLSKGMLHHTPSTRRALATFRSTLQQDASMFIWIYPTHEEGPEWSLLYHVRDYLFMGQGPRLPATLVRWLSYVLVALLFPLAEYTLRKGGERVNKSFPWFDPKKMSLAQRYNAQVFYLNDTLLPRYLFKHSIAEMNGWFREEGLEPIFEKHGFYSARVVEPPKADGATSAARRDVPAGV